MRMLPWKLAIVVALTAHAAAAQDAPNSAAAWREDLSVIAREVPRIHPDLFCRMSRASWDSAVTAIDRRLPQMSRDQAIVALMELVALPRDGHTSIHPLFDSALRFRYYPIELAAMDDGVFVTAADPVYARAPWVLA